VILYDAIKDQIFEYYQKNNTYIVFDGTKEYEVCPFNIWVCLALTKEVICLE
jgi:hypothetical protein